MGQFNQLIVEEDHSEALRINELFDKHASDGSNNVLSDALEEAEIEFTQEFRDTLGTETFGYSVAKNALRWLAYSNAYLRDAEEGSTDQHLSDGQIAEYGEEISSAEDELMVLNSSHFKLFDILEKERIRDHLSGRAATNPFELTRSYASSLLLNVIDAVVEDDESASLGFMYHGAVYDVLKSTTAQTKVYKIDEYPEGTPILGPPNTIYNLEVDRSPFSLPSLKDHKGMPVSIGTALYLVNAAANHDSYYEDAAVARIANNLQTERQILSQRG